MQRCIGRTEREFSERMHHEAGIDDCPFRQSAQNVAEVRRSSVYGQTSAVKVRMHQGHINLLDVSDLCLQTLHTLL